MTTNKPGSVNQRPLYGCTSCYEDYSWPASDLRVYDGECWCDLCWAERQWELPGRPCWNDLEPYAPAPLPAEQQPGPDAAGLVEALGLALEYWRHRQQRYKNRRPKWVIAAEAALAGHRREPSHDNQ